jgi:DNA-binding response OmpR family regulator
VEDDAALAMGTEYALQAEGYRVIRTANLAEARRALQQQPDLVLLDVMLPDGTGYDFCREIRQTDSVLPILFLTAVSEEVNIVQGLELGADDYIAKPYRVKELMSRIAANLRRCSHSTESFSAARTVHFGLHSFDFGAFRLTREGEVVDCTPSELRLLRELIQNQGLVLSRSSLLERLYDTGESFVDDNTLSVYMKRLRGKLGVDADWIETVRGVGYRFRQLGDSNEK